MSATTRAAVAGIAIGLLMCVLGLAAAGAGHGWNTPLFFSPVCLLSYPWMLVRRANGSGGATDWLFIIAGFVLDVLLFASTMREGFDNIDRVSGRAAVWLVLWFGWQALAISNLARARQAARR